ncbi:MAG: hypothetical protein PUC06_01645 [Oscillospiraceae bacterium]|nr:hypothetical protein [Oscillospiraceae bacterium]
MTEKKRRIPLGYVVLGIAILLVLAVAISVIYRNYRIEQSFRGNGAVNFRVTRLESSRKLLAELGADLKMPGTDGERLRFTAPFGFTFQDTAYNQLEVRRGDSLECDFVSWSHDFFSLRLVILQVNGREISARMSHWTLARLYRAALKQNHREEQFREDYGRGLSLRSARKALRVIDKEIFDLGLYLPTDYPYNRVVAKKIMIFLMVFSLPLCLMGTLSVTMLISGIRYRIWLRAYNREHRESWDRVAGTLPQFESLRADGLDRPVPIPQKPNLRNQMKELFR